MGSDGLEQRYIPAHGGPVLVRSARAEDVEAVRELERRAGAPFRAIGLDAVADDEPPETEVLLAAAEQGELFVVEGERLPGAPAPSLAAWLWLGVVDGDLHVEQVSVDPGMRGRRIGSALVRCAVDRARTQRRPGVVLTTFRDVPWNGPLYRGLGFRDMDEADIGPELRRIRQAETAAGLDVLPRVCLRYPLSD